MTEKKVIRVADVMEQDYTLVDGVVTVAEALAILQEKDAHFLIVEKRSEDDEYGMILISDVARKVLAVDRAPDRVNVYEIMQKPVIAVDPGMDIRYCARLLERFEITRTPVIENNEVVGIVSFTELVMLGMRSRWESD